MALDRTGDRSPAPHTEDHQYQSYCGCDERTLPYWGVLLIALGLIWALDFTGAIDVSVELIVGPVLVVAWGLSILWSLRLRDQI